MNPPSRIHPTFAAAILALVVVAACGQPDTPEIVAVSYVRAQGSGDAETALDLLDIDRIAARVEEQLTVLDSSGRETFLEDTIESLLWGMFRETPQGDYAYGGVSADVDGAAATVDVSRTDAQGKSEVVVVHLSDTGSGWRVSGASLDKLVRYVVQRLQEQY